MNDRDSAEDRERWRSINAGWRTGGLIRRRDEPEIRRAKWPAVAAPFKRAVTLIATIGSSLWIPMVGIDKDQQ